jgi:uncharacterized repeat protein (TIGR02543 family)
MAILTLVAAFAMVSACGNATSNTSSIPTSTLTYTVTYDANTGAGSAPIDSNTYSSTFTVTVLSSGTLTKAGYTFTCWNTQADGNGTDRSPLSTFAMGSANVILYAKWTADPTYTVTYNANTGTGSVLIDSNSYLAGATVTVLGNGTLTKTGYTFSGWNTQADGNGTDRATSSTFTMGSANVILYAKWTSLRYPALVAVGQVSLTNSSSVRNPSVAALTSSNFAGSTIISGSNVVLNNGADTLIANGVVASTSGNFLADIVQNNSSITSSTLWSYLFTQLRSDTYAGLLASGSVITNCNTYNFANASGTLWLNCSNFNPTSGTVIGSLSNPVILIVNNNVNLSNNVTIYGMLYVTGGISASSSFNIYGLLASEGSVSMNNADTIEFNSQVLTTLGLIPLPSGAVWP